ncbi:MAG: YjgP/YjgQ family permease [Planctomycetes bacterium]|nr:YjgP/YjgQ family permease [Planctomycetota bacterium]
MLFQRRLLAEMLRNAAITLGVLTAILVLVMSGKAVHQEGLSLATFLRLVPLLTLANMHVTLPLAVLVAVVLTYGRAAADNEVDALRASGVHPWHVGLPALVFGALGTLVLLVALDVVTPWASIEQKRAFKEFDWGEVLRGKLDAGEPVKLDERTWVSADGFTAEGLALGVRVQIYGDDRSIEREILADSAELGVSQARGELTVTLRAFHTVRGPRTEGATMTITKPLPREMVELDSRTLSTTQLLATLQRGGPLAGLSLRQAELEVHMRLASAAACLLFVFLGLPVALLFRRGDRTAAFLIAFLIVLFVYYPAREVSLYLSDRELLSPLAASWSGSVLLLAGGLVLCRRVLLR